MIWRADLAIELRAILTAAVILLIAGSQAVIYCSLPILSNNIHTVALLILALVLLDSEEGARPTIRRAAVIAAAVCAAFGIIGGLFAPLVLLWVAWAGGLGRGWLITISLIATILFACFLPGVPTGHLSDWPALPRVAEYHIRLLGLPWSHAASLVWFGRLAGCVVLGASIITFFRCGLRGRRLRQVERIGLASLIFGLLITAMIALGRWSVLPEQPVPNSIRHLCHARRSGPGSGQHALARTGLAEGTPPNLSMGHARGYRFVADSAGRCRPSGSCYHQ